MELAVDEVIRNLKECRKMYPDDCFADDIKVAITTMQKYQKKKKLDKLSKLGLYVGFSVGYVAVYSIAVLIIFAIKGVEPEVLTKCVYGFFGGEVTIAGLIKIFNIKEEHKQIKKTEEEPDEETF